MENVVCNLYREKLAILNTENVKICVSVTKLKRQKCNLFAFFTYLLNICRKFEFLIFQGSVATRLR